jgi:hypothetical protein
VTSRPPSHKRPWFVALSATLFAAVAIQGQVTFYQSKAAFDAVTGTMLLEDFESFSPQDTVIIPSFTSHGVTYTGFAGSPSGNVYVESPGMVYGLGASHPATSSVLTANGDEDFTAAFSTAVSAVGFDTYLNGLGPVTIGIYNGATLLDSFSYAGSVNTEEYLGIVSTIPITSFRFTSAQGGIVDTGIDNISVAAVPEPTSTALALAGVLLSVTLYSRARCRRGAPITLNV